MRPYVVGLLGLLTILGAVWMALGERDRDLARLVTDLTRGPGPAQAPATAPAATAPPPATAPIEAAPPPPPRPSFDIVRVNARGDAVMAGRAAPHADIVILDGPREIGRVKADDRGEWVFVPSGPMPPGGRELSLRARNPDGSVWESASALVLVVPERDRDVAGRPVAPGAAPPPIALLTPREPGGALQVLQAPRADEPPAAAAEPQPAEPQAAAPAPLGALPAPVAAPVPSAPVTPPLAAAPALPAPQVIPPPPVPHAAPRAPAAAAPPAPEPAPPSPVFAARPSPGAAAPPATEPAPPSPVFAAPPLPPVAAPALPPPIAAPAPPPPIAAPAPPPPTVVAAAPPAGPTRPVAPPAIPQGRPPGGVSVDAVDYGPGGDVSFAGRAGPGESVRLYLDDQHLGDARADAEGRWNLAPRTPIEPGRTQALRADQVAPDGRVTARVQVPFQRAETPPEGLSAGSIIVQPGHSLWRIARETYGRGIRYTVIYEANREQIRNPDLIYPGQVFVLPGGDRGG